ncbi:DUF2637 domain-containing protein [Thermostaphylospora chromogena]|uniref:DUF2637 domain-containing protein n=1 Tax=Thermostaphylospora chromogena TaxID=35622 RepID=UPI000B83CA47|nr:DUF2637 domain-containing protein [Thermostaphylospora chromogena]
MKIRTGDRLPGSLLVGASLLVVAALIGAGIVGYEAQRLFALAHNHIGPETEADRLRAVIIAALPDVGWVAMALVALVAALRGQSSLRARVGVVVFFGLSLGAQVLYAPRTLEGILVAIIAPVAMAWMLETLVVEVRRWAAARRGLTIDETPILTGVLRAAVGLVRALLGILLWLVRLVLAPRSTFDGVREWVLDTAPIAPGRSLASMRAAEAAERAAMATADVERIRKAEAEARAAIEARAASELEALRAEREQAERAAAQEVARVRQEAEARLQAMAEANAAEQAEHANRIADLSRELATVRAELDRARAQAARMERAEAMVQQLRTDLSTAQETYSLLERYAGARAIARTRYEGLRLAGDPRYGDPAYLSELARDWAPSLHRSESTVRRYLADHLADPHAAAGGED